MVCRQPLAYGLLCCSVISSGVTPAAASATGEVSSAIRCMGRGNHNEPGTGFFYGHGAMFAAAALAL